MNIDERIQNYNNNRLSDEDRKLVKDLLDSDPEFKAEFDTHTNVSEAFKISEAESLKRKFQQIEGKTPKKKGLLNDYKYVYLAIASIVVVGFFYNTFIKQSGIQLFDSNFEIYPNTYQPVTRSSETSTNNSAFTAYENGDFSSAEIGFKSRLELADNPNIQFYYASSLLNQSKLKQALKEFETLNKLEFDYTSESLWYSALIHIKNEDFKKAKENLEKLNSRNSKFKSKERDLLLQKLKD